MALEPITRQEKIIAGKDLEPVTRMEMFLKQYGGGGGGASSSDVFIIHATPDETYTNAQLDKTAEQIYEAYQSGKYCLACFDGTFFHVSTVGTDGQRYLMRCYGFKFLSDVQLGIVILELTTGDGGATWAIVPKPPLLNSVRFNNPQITGYGGFMYTISVDADGNLTATKVT